MGLEGFSDKKKIVKELGDDIEGINEVKIRPKSLYASAIRELVATYLTYEYLPLTNLQKIQDDLSLSGIYPTMTEIEKDVMSLLSKKRHGESDSSFLSKIIYMDFNPSFDASISQSNRRKTSSNLSIEEITKKNIDLLEGIKTQEHKNEDDVTIKAHEMKEMLEKEKNDRFLEALEKLKGVLSTKVRMYYEDIVLEKYNEDNRRDLEELEISRKNVYSVTVDNTEAYVDEHTKLYIKYLNSNKIREDFKKRCVINTVENKQEDKEISYDKIIKKNTNEEETLFNVYLEYCSNFPGAIDLIPVEYRSRVQTRIEYENEIKKGLGLEVITTENNIKEEIVSDSLELDNTLDFSDFDSLLVYDSSEIEHFDFDLSHVEEQPTFNVSEGVNGYLNKFHNEFHESNKDNINVVKDEVVEQPTFNVSEGVNGYLNKFHNEFHESNKDNINVVKDEVVEQPTFNVSEGVNGYLNKFHNEFHESNKDNINVVKEEVVEQPTFNVSEGVNDYLNKFHKDSVDNVNVVTSEKQNTVVKDNEVSNIVESTTDEQTEKKTILINGIIKAKAYIGEFSSVKVGEYDAMVKMMAEEKHKLTKCSLEELQELYNSKYKNVTAKDIPVDSYNK
ncbi:MAG: hypothetical protein R3Y13_04340 [bacterium]